jgi:pilus assembly protein CpaC
MPGFIIGVFAMLLVNFLNFGLNAQTVVQADRAISVNVSQGNLIRLERAASGVFIADPNIADVQAQSDSLIYIFGKKSGKTTLFAVDDEGVVIGEFSVKVIHDVVELNRNIDEMIGDGVRASSVTNGILLSGTTRSSADIEDVRQLTARYLGEDEVILNRISLSSPTQVNLHVRVAEVSRSIDKIFGINWDSLFSIGDFTFGLATGRSFTGAGAGFTRFVDAEGPAGALAGSYVTGDVTIDGIVDALEREGLVTLLAQPNLTALSGETASFLAGGEFPVPVGVDNNEIEIEFKEFGVSLNFTPTVLANDRISLRVNPEVSELSDDGAITLNNIVIPALATRRAETTVELGHGQSFAIGGLVSNSTTNNIEKFPGLGDIPVLGTLFRSNNFQQDESELIIIVTPYLVKPAIESEIATPLDGIRPPTDVERILQGRLFVSRDIKDDQQDVLAGAGIPRLNGNAGFILD